METGPPDTPEDVFSLSEDLVAFHRRSGEKSPIIFSGDMCG